MTTTIHPRHRRMYALAAALIVTLAAALLPANPALAADNTMYYGAAGASGYYYWDNDENKIQLLARPTTLPSGWCYDTKFDWGRFGLHYDARVARSCRSNTVRNTQISTEGWNVSGVNKAGVCYGPNQATNSGACATGTTNGEGVVGDIEDTFAENQTCLPSWSMTPTRTLQFFGGFQSNLCDG